MRIFCFMTSHRHAAEVRALQASLQEKDAQIRGIQSQMQAFTDVKELYSKMLLDDCDELRIRRMLVSKTCQYRTLLHKVTHPKLYTRWRLSHGSAHCVTPPPPPHGDPPSQSCPRGAA